LSNIKNEITLSTLVTPGTLGTYFLSLPSKSRI
jgi:hypothetical protein